MQLMSIHFVETMRGYGAAIVPQTSDTGSWAFREERAFSLALRQIAVLVDTAASTSDGGLRGSIQSGTIEAPGLDAQALRVERGQFELLSEATGGERRMRYHLYCRTQSGEGGFLLYGFKRIANQSGKPLPLAIWQETTTLYVSIYELKMLGAGALAEQPGPLIATGVIHIHWADFIRQMLTFRSYGAAGVLGHIRNMWSFGRFFVAALASVYLRRNA